MFTGIIQTLGTIQSVKRTENISEVTCKSPQDFLEDVQVGDSIAINGVCLTVTALNQGEFGVHVVRETRQSTTIQFLKTHDVVNLEKALSAKGRFDGHIVQGHVDGVCTVQAIAKQGEYYVFKFLLENQSDYAYLVKKASIAIEGISLTIQSVEERGFSVAVIPHTYAITNLAKKRVGDPINYEIDIIAKYVFNSVNSVYAEKDKLSIKKLKELGF